MKKYNIIIRFEDKEMEVEVEAENWEMLCDYVFGRIEINENNKQKL